jgi:hypothetical protein
MVSARKVIGAGLAIMGFCGILSIFIVHLKYHQSMPREAQQETGRVLRYRAMRTTVYVNERELRIAKTAALMAALGFPAFALGAYLSTDGKTRATP